MASARRVIVQADHTALRTGLPLLASIAGFTLLATLAVYTPVALGLLAAVMGAVYPLLVALVAGGFSEETSSGVAQVYLATGLHRSEYYLSWLLLVMGYSVPGVLAATAVPVLLLSPELASSKAAYGMIVYSLLMALQAPAVSMGLAALMRSRGSVVAAATAYHIIGPMAASMLLGIAGLHDAMAAGVAFFNPAFTMMANPEVELARVAAALLPIPIFLAMGLARVSRMEV